VYGDYVGNKNYVVVPLDFDDNDFQYVTEYLDLPPNQWEETFNHEIPAVKIKTEEVPVPDNIVSDLEIKDGFFPEGGKVAKFQELDPESNKVIKLEDNKDQDELSDEEASKDNEPAPRKS
jgi:hypothetical protein